MGTANRASERLHEGCSVEKGQVPFNIRAEVLRASGTARADRHALDADPVTVQSRAYDDSVTDHGLHRHAADGEDPRVRPDEVLRGLDELGQPGPAAIPVQY